MVVPTDLIPPGEAADLLGVSVDTLRRWTKDGQLRAVRVGKGHRRYSRDQLLALVAKSQVGQPEDAA